MAIMQASDRRAAMVEFLGEIGRLDTVFNVSKTDLQAAVDAADQWVSDNAASFNSALPVAARTALTAAQKAAVLSYVLKRRYAAGV